MDPKRQKQRSCIILVRRFRVALSLVSAAVVILVNGSALAYTDVEPEAARQMSTLGLRHAVLAMQLAGNLHADGGLIVVDVRQESEFCGSGGHIPGAVNHPWNGVVVEGYSELSPTALVLVV